jgi:DNA-binding NtrC family response regulator
MSTKQTIGIGDRALELRLEGFALTVVEGPDAGQSARGNAAELSIGTAEGNELRLTDPTVSRHHCSLTATSKGIRVRDLGSSNGTSVEGVRIESGYIDHGEILKIGRTVVRLDTVDADIVVPLSAEERFGRVLGKSSAMRKIFSLLPKIAQSDTTVLLEGETGTGKGVMAEAIHEASARNSGPFVVLDCAAIPPTLIESELFGHVRGSFTGATTDRAGAFEQARGGTIFIDEIGELPLDMQPKLLRALEERTVKRVGGTERIKLDVRVVAATNRDLRTEVNEGSFRADLFYRLNVVRVRVPPLRERRDDVEMLARHYFEQFAPSRTMGQALLDKLLHQAWPGNVRELRGAVERAALLDDGLLELDDGTPPTSTPPDAVPFDPAVPFRVAKQHASDAWERHWLRALMDHANGNLSAAARTARMDRSHLRDLLKRHGLHGSSES